MPRRPPIDPQGYYHVGSRGSLRPTALPHARPVRALPPPLRTVGREIQVGDAHLGADAEPPSLHHQAQRRRPVGGDARAPRLVFAADPRYVRHDRHRDISSVTRSSAANCVPTPRSWSPADTSISTSRPPPADARRQLHWGGYRATVGLERPRPFHKPDELLGIISPVSPTPPERAYRQFVQEGLDSRGHDPSPNQGVGQCAAHSVVESRS